MYTKDFERNEYRVSHWIPDYSRNLKSFEADYFLGHFIRGGLPTNVRPVPVTVFAY